MSPLFVSPYLCVPASLFLLSLSPTSQLCLSLSLHHLCLSLISLPISLFFSLSLHLCPSRDFLGLSLRRSVSVSPSSASVSPSLCLSASWLCLPPFPVPSLSHSHSQAQNSLFILRRQPGDHSLLHPRPSPHAQASASRPHAGQTSGRTSRPGSAPEFYRLGQAEPRRPRGFRRRPGGMSSLQVGLDFISFLCRSCPRSSSRAGRADESAGSLLPPSGERRKRRRRVKIPPLQFTMSPAHERCKYEPISPSRQPHEIEIILNPTYNWETEVRDFRSAV